MTTKLRVMDKDVRVLNKKPRYPLVKDGNQVSYLLLHVNLPSDTWSARSARKLHGVESAQRAGKILNITIWTMRLPWSKGEGGGYRYFFRFPRYRRDDKRAQHIGECFLHALSLTFGPFLDTSEQVSVFRVPADLVRKPKIISTYQLVQLEETRGYNDRTLEFPSYSLSTVFNTAQWYFDAAWKITPVLVQNDQLYRATQFLKASQDDFFVWPGEIEEILDDPNITASTSFRQTELENALQNTFKSVEAVLGDPPKDDKKFFAKIMDIGLDPQEEVGYIDKVPLHSVIRNMNDARDKKAAHGSTPHRNITIGELMGYQSCARHIIWAALEKELGEPIYPKAI